MSHHRYTHYTLPLHFTCIELHG